MVWSYETLNSYGQTFVKVERGLPEVESKATERKWEYIEKGEYG